MKFKFNIKLCTFLLAIFFLLFSIYLMYTTYARYVTALTATSTVELGSWMIEVNNQNIIENSDLSEKIIPIFDSNTEYIAEGKIVPTSTGYVEIDINYEKVNVPFEYKISFSQSNSTILEDFKFTSYSIDGGSLITVDDSSPIITETISPTETPRTRSLLLNFAWVDGTGETFNDINDTAYSRNFDELGLQFNIEFIQLQPSS